MGGGFTRPEWLGSGRDCPPRMGGAGGLVRGSVARGSSLGEGVRCIGLWEREDTDLVFT